MQSRYMVAGVVTVMLLMSFADALPAEDETHPIWWSPSLGLEKLDDAEKYLEDPASLGGGVSLIKVEGDERQEATAESCGSLNRLMQKGYHAGFAMHSIRVVLYHLAKCYAIELLLEARPAKKSYVRDFRLDADSMNYLPAMVKPSPSCDWLCRQYVANERRISWKQFEPTGILSVDHVSDHQIKVETSGTNLSMEILARADFNGDGLEDLLLWVHAGAIGGTWGTTKLYLLSREKPESVLWVLDAEEEICSPISYRPCDTDYDIPEALRRAD